MTQILDRYMVNNPYECPINIPLSMLNILMDACCSAHLISGELDCQALSAKELLGTRQFMTGTSMDIGDLQHDATVFGMFRRLEENHETLQYKNI